MSRPPKVVLVAGLSGVGKSYVIEHLRSTSDRFLHFSAGSLIQKKRLDMERDELRLFDNEGILQNQYMLVEQFAEEVDRASSSSNKTILFDAHMLIDTDQDIVVVPFDVFEKINPVTFVFLKEDPHKILERRTADTSRARPMRSAKEIREHQDESLKLAHEYADKLGVLLKVANSSQLDLIADFLK